MAGCPRPATSLMLKPNQSTVGTVLVCFPNFSNSSLGAAPPWALAVLEIQKRNVCTALLGNSFLGVFFCCCKGGLGVFLYARALPNSESWKRTKEYSSLPAEGFDLVLAKLVSIPIQHLSFYTRGKINNPSLRSSQLIFEMTILQWHFRFSTFGQWPNSSLMKNISTGHGELIPKAAWV